RLMKRASPLEALQIDAQNCTSICATRSRGKSRWPDSTSLQGDLTSIGYKFTSDGKLLLESKDDMRRRGVPSPDEGDAVALCFTEPGGSPVPRSIAMNFNRRIEYQNAGWV